MSPDTKLENLWTTKAGLRAACWWVNGSHRCGYVEVPEGHPLYKIDYDESRLYSLDVHGGLTFSRLAEKDYPGPGDNWWFGFDCAHYGDLMMRYDMPDLYLQDEGVFRTQEYVEAECERLAEQIQEVREEESE